MNNVESVKQACGGVVSALGFELYEVTFKREISGMVLTFFIEKAGGAVTVEDCEKVSAAIDPVLDGLEAKGEITMPEGYSLSVSSLGLDWPIKTERDLDRNRGKAVEVKLYSKIDGKKDFVGELVGWTEKQLTLRVDGKERVFARNAVANIAPHIEF